MGEIRASRFSRAPVHNRRGEVKDVLDINDNDLDSFLLCYEHFAPIPYLAAYTGRNQVVQRDRVRQLKRQTPPYLEVWPRQLKVKGRFQVGYQHLSVLKPAIDLLLERDDLPLLFPGSSSYDHDVKLHEIMLSWKLGFKQNPLYRIANQNQVYEQLPKDRDKKIKWYDFPLTGGYTKWKNLRPDYFPTGVVRPFDSPGEHPFMVPEFETGNNNRNLTSGDTSTLEHKLKGYLEILWQEDEKGNYRHPVYYTHMGIPHLYPTFFFLEEKDLLATLELIGMHIPAWYQQFFLCKLFQPLGPSHKPDVSDYALTEDFVRVGTPFNFLTTPMEA